MELFGTPAFLGEPDLGLASMLRYRVRYFTDAAMIGSREIVNEAFAGRMDLVATYPGYWAFGSRNPNDLAQNFLRMGILSYRWANLVKDGSQRTPDKAHIARAMATAGG